MWIQKDKTIKKISRNEVLDWVVINGVLWVEVADKKEVEKCIARC
ncbi:MAG: hypothetical protein ABIC68_04280 [Candidatus Omnitrophota bacterium]